MKAENRDELEYILKELKQLRNNIYDYDYDEYVLWHLDEAIKQLDRV